MRLPLTLPGPAKGPKAPAFRLRIGPTEHDIQVAVFQWAALACRAYPELAVLFAIPNAGHRSVGAARYMLAEGMKPGVPDVCLPVPRGTFGALFIEHKSDSGRVTPEQARWQELLATAGNKVVVSRSFNETREAILAYLAS